MNKDRRPGEAQLPQGGAKETLSKLFDIPLAALANTQIEISDNREAIVNGCQGVLSYDENMIRLSCSKMTMSFWGRGLQIKALTHTSAVVSGYIEKIEFAA